MASQSFIHQDLQGDGYNMRKMRLRISALLLAALFTVSLLSTTPTVLADGGGGNWLQNWGYRKAVTLEGSSDGVQTDYQMKIITYYNETPYGIADFVTRYQGISGQGIATDGTNLWANDGNTLSKYDMSGTSLLNHTNAHQDGTNMEQINGMNYKDGLLYIGSNNYNNEPKLGYIKIFNATTLAYVEEHQVLAHWSEGGAWHDGYFWAVYTDWMYVSQYNDAWVHQDDYELTYTFSSGTNFYQGAAWKNGYMYVNTHEGTAPTTCDIYYWTGTGFDEYFRLQPPTNWAHQGIHFDPTNDTELWWVERNYPEIGENTLLKSELTVEPHAVGLNAKCRTDFGDVRITANDGITILAGDGNGWMETYTIGEAASIFVKIPTIPAYPETVDLYVYYGNNAASWTDNRTETMLFINDFESGTVENFTELYGTASASMEQVIVREGSYSLQVDGGNGGYHTPDELFWSSPNIAIEFWIYAGAATVTTEVKVTWVKAGDEVRSCGIGLTAAVLACSGIENLRDGDFRGQWLKAVFYLQADNDLVDMYVYDSDFYFIASLTDGNIQDTTKTYRDVLNYNTAVAYIDAVISYQFTPNPPMFIAWGEEESPNTAYTFYGLYDETSGDLLTTGVNVTAYYTDGTASSTFEVNGSYYLQTFTIPQYFHYELGSNDREYWLSSGENETTLYIYNETTTLYTITFLDLAGALHDYAFVEAQRYISGSLRIVEKRKVDEQNKLQFSMIQGEKYTLEIKNGASYTFGELLFTSDTTITLTLKGIEFPQDVILSYRYVRVYAERHNNLSSVSVLFEETQSRSCSVEIDILYENLTSLGGIYPYTYGSTTAFNHTWVSANYTFNYVVQVEITHPSYGVMNYNQILARGFSVAPWDFPLGTLSIEFDTAYILPIILIIACFLIFSRINAYIAPFLATCVAILLTWWGWIPISSVALMASMVFSIILALVYKKKRYS